MTGKAFLALFAMLLLFAAGILAGVALMLTAFGRELETELDGQVDVVQRDFEREVNGLQREIGRELDRRLGPARPTTP